MHGNEPIFLKIAADFRHLIDLGIYHEGDPLPSVREIAVSYSVNPNTAARSYSELINDGYVLSKPKKGYYVAKISNGKSKEAVIIETLKPLLENGYSKEEIKEVLDAWKY